MMSNDNRLLCETILTLMDQLQAQERENDILRAALENSSAQTQASEDRYNTQTHINLILRSENELLRQQLQRKDLALARHEADVKCAVDAALEARYALEEANENLVVRSVELADAKSAAKNAGVREDEARVEVERYREILAAISTETRRKRGALSQFSSVRDKDLGNAEVDLPKGRKRSFADVEPEDPAAPSERVSA